MAPLWCITSGPPPPRQKHTANSWIPQTNRAYTHTHSTIVLGDISAPSNVEPRYLAPGYPMTMTGRFQLARRLCQWNGAIYILGGRVGLNILGRGFNYRSMVIFFISIFLSWRQNVIEKLYPLSPPIWSIYIYIYIAKWKRSCRCLCASRVGLPYEMIATLQARAQKESCADIEADAKRHRTDIDMNIVIILMI